MKSEVGVPDSDLFSSKYLSLSSQSGLGTCDPVLTVGDAGVGGKAEVGEQQLHGGVRADGVGIQDTKQVIQAWLVYCVKTCIVKNMQENFGQFSKFFRFISFILMRHESVQPIPFLR